MFYYVSQEDRACWYQGAVYRIPKTLQLRQRQMGVTLPMGQRQNPARGVSRSARLSPTHGTLARRGVRRPCLVQTQKTAVPLNSSCPDPAVRQEAEIFVSAPLIELPDPEGFYASLVLRKVRAELEPRWELSECNSSSPKRTVVDRPSAAKISSKVARCGTAGEPLEMILAEMALRYMQTPVLGGRSS